MNILKNDGGEEKTWDEVHAYLEHHRDNKDRVKVVVEELRQVNSDISPPDSPVRRSPSPEVGRKKGGVGKGKKKPVPKMIIGEEAGSSSSVVEGEASSPGEEKEQGTKRERVEEVGREEEEAATPSKKPRNSEARRRSPPSDNPDLIHGPFDFMAHRSGNSK